MAVSASRPAHQLDRARLRPTHPPNAMVNRNRYQLLLLSCASSSATQISLLLRSGLRTLGRCDTLPIPSSSLVRAGSSGDCSFSVSPSWTSTLDLARPLECGFESELRRVSSRAKEGSDPRVNCPCFCCGGGTRWMVVVVSSTCAPQREGSEAVGDGG